MTNQERCRRCGASMRKTDFGYSYCTSIACGHREWDDPQNLCCCKSCERERTGNGQAAGA